MTKSTPSPQYITRTLGPCADRAPWIDCCGSLDAPEAILAGSTRWDEINEEPVPTLAGWRGLI